MLAERIDPEKTALKAYVQKAHAFALPKDLANVPIIMMRPRYRRRAVPRLLARSSRATKAPGRNWLFFGHQRSSLRLLL